MSQWNQNCRQSGRRRGLGQNLGAAARSLTQHRGALGGRERLVKRGPYIGVCVCTPWEGGAPGSTGSAGIPSKLRVPAGRETENTDASEKSSLEKAPEELSVDTSVQCVDRLQA